MVRTDRFTEKKFSVLELKSAVYFAIFGEEKFADTAGSLGRVYLLRILYDYFKAVKQTSRH